MKRKNKLQVLAIIPARAGSKRLPGKNKKRLGNRPLIAWTIQTSLGIRGICDILVSTDDPFIRKISQKMGVLAPWLRPKGLSSNSATSAAVVLHALRWYEKTNRKVDGVLLLQPTSPFRTKTRIRLALKYFNEDKRKPIVSVVKMHRHPLWCVKKKGKLCVPFFKKHGLYCRSQQLGKAYAFDGNIYLCSALHVKKTKSLIGKENVFLETPTFKEALEIDDKEDFKLAQLLLK